MKHRLYNNPDWSKQVDQSKIEFYYREFQNLSNRYPLYPVHSKSFREHILSDWYFELSEVRTEYIGSYAEFVQTMENGPWKCYPWYASRVKTSFRQRSSYRKLPHHQSKVLSEEEVQAREWKSYKNKKKKRNRRWPFKDKAKRCLHKKHRKFIKSKIASGQYELINNNSLELFWDDPYYWS